MNTFTCQNPSCGAVKEYEPLFVDGRERFKPRLCPVCFQAEQRALAEAKVRERLDALPGKWDAICPESYRLTDPNFPLMNQALLKGLMRYNPTGGRGIGLYGETGLRKTRMMFLVLKKLHFSGLDCFYVSAKRLAGCFAIRYGKDNESGKARDVIRRCYSSGVLFLDDIGKQKFSDDGQSEFYYLIEDRTSRLKPILWTANASGDELAAMMSPDRGRPIVRRLEDFSEVIGVES